MTILVTGSNGQLGSEMRLVAAMSEDRYIFTDVVDLPGVETEMLDITDPDAVRTMVKENDVKVIVNCAAYTNVDKAEEEQELCTLLNAKAPENLAVAMKEAGGCLVHVSTDYVFGGGPAIGPCREDDEAHPVSIYGRTKRQGEQAVVASGCHYLIIRTSWLYSEFGRNFVKTMIALISQKDSVKVVSDQIGTPTYALDLAEVIYESVSGRRYEGQDGIYHYSNDGVCSWFEFARKIAEYVGNASCKILPCATEEYSSRVKRPAYSVLDKTKIKKTFGISIPTWTESLKKCIKNLK